MPFQGAAHNPNSFLAIKVIYSREDIPPGIPKPVVAIRVERAAGRPIPEITEQLEPRINCVSFKFYCFINKKGEDPSLLRKFTPENV